MKGPRTLSTWAFLQIWRPDDVRTPQAPILAGIDELGLNRTSTPLMEFDPVTGVGVTASGREYRLAGSEDPVAALRVFGSLWMLQHGQEVRRVAPKDVPAVIATSASSAPKSAEQQTEEDSFRIRACISQINRLARLAAITECDVAGMLGISLYVYADLPAGIVPVGLTLDQTESVLAHVNDRLQGRAVGLHGQDSEVRAARMRDTGKRMEQRMAETYRHRIERAAFTLPYLQLSDPDMDAEECAAALGVTGEELRQILDEIPNDDDKYTVPAPRMRH
jgi:hypothetical protein